MQDVLEDLARADVPRHRNVETRAEILQGVGHRGKPVREMAKRLPDELAEIPHADRHDISRMSLPQDYRRGLPPFAGQSLADRETRGVEATADARQRRPSL